MATLSELVAARRDERMNNPRRYAARQRLKARDRNCPLRIISEGVTSSINTISEGVSKVDLSKSVLPGIHVELSGVAEKVKRLRAPITAMDLSFDGAFGEHEFGGDVFRYATYHLIDRYRRGTSFAPFVRQFLADFNAARQQDRTLTREGFFKTYSDQIMAFLASYKLVENPTTNEARLEFIALRFLIAAVIASRESQDAELESISELVHEGKLYAACKLASEVKAIQAACELARDAEARFLALDNCEIMRAVEQGGFKGLKALQHEREALRRFNAFKFGE